MNYNPLRTSRNLLFPGSVSKEQFYLLVDISSLRSNKVIKALHNYFVLGHSRNNVCEEFNVNPGYLSIKIKELQSLSRKLLDFYLYFPVASAT
ncbi:PapB/FocB family fimbrial expression transcriptional regulator [Citrobacter portucalensis]|uniref:PapB/FocB family fimbrial expression transcriptional regulator n=1 Tax=Citrobacter portucalensis TaxID=1639133 RepID=UPI00288AA052|nr:PapB/FocB family fimbrial expression transcriptional regulator [Citrobacter portucalensis]WNI84223.1 PapB/FocB family fimbrial expression transcriptional regulator [Citrobacter portucalensis]